MMTKLTENQRAIVDSNNGLRRYLESLLEGKPMTQRSWLYENVSDPNDILAQWKEQLVTLEKGNSFSQNVYHFDISQEEKWGPQGGVAPIKELMDDVVLQGFGSFPKPKAFRTKEWIRAKDAVARRLRDVGIQSLRPASYSQVVEDMRVRDTLESNSGWPLFTRRSKPEVKSQSIEEAENGLWKTYPAIALFRNYNGKTRMVWMFPMSANLVEGSFFQPLQSAIVKSPWGRDFFAPWVGFEQVRHQVHLAYGLGKTVAASDFSSTDAHFQLATSMEVSDVIEQCFQYQYRDALRGSIEYMHTIPLVVGPNEILVGEHGVSSGSNWTNFIETIFDWILATYVNILTGGKHKGLYAIGDDMAWVCNTFDDGFEHFLEEVGESVGQVIKAEKTTNDPGKVKSLQRLFQNGYNRSSDGYIRGVYPTVRALKSSVFPERFHNPKLWSSDMFCARQFMILENCVDHPLFEDFVKFVCNGQKDLIPFAQKSYYKLSDITWKTRLLPGLNSTYNQERRDQSLGNFESIKIARNL
nr:MAG: putative RNA-dependent RNA polymerase [Picobirnavirus sp.]